MPYRRLPTTDKARIRAMESALKLADKTSEEKLAFSRYTYQQLKQVKIAFESTLLQYDSDLQKQANKQKEYKVVMEKAVMYISHFVQALYMSVEREETKRETLKFYELDSLNGKLPPLNTENDIIEWGEKVVSGEQKRIQSGGSPIYSPSIALVKIRLQDFKDIAIFMQNMRRISNRSFERMKEIRISTNDFISKLWNEIEEHVNSDSPKHKRQQAQEYGIVYVFRRKEKKKLRAVDLQVDLLFEYA
ncbi:hypothetical protein [Maribellus maritimus]|uniref:hypothetical protein n=1 Tax=Maribellus maritimus TaxID=2870838 RepID=UPI001EECBC67|nr:hypothetical protein [Maribellus maritimus]MCG6187515.1 hypothetical protein [Maribellus maritimus]